ncbi:MAG: class I SAM-dependent methyltransferase, partial [Acidobacteriota bacterium]|nr:class I SAM-dependent methyltransferase [Acidobacteriota bacterium]
AFAQERAGHGRLFPPEDLGALEGPDRDAYQKPEQVMDALGIADGSRVADLGAGGGWFTIRLARRVGPNGVVYAEDIQPQMLESIKRRVEREQLQNVRAVLGQPADPNLPPGELHAVLIVDTFNAFERPVVVLQRVRESLRPGGRVGIIEYKKDGHGPGPAMEDRVDPDVVVAAARAAGLRLAKREDFLRYQYMLVFEAQ